MGYQFIFLCLPPFNAASCSVPLRAFGYKDAETEKGAAVGVSESRAKREMM